MSANYTIPEPIEQEIPCKVSHSGWLRRHNVFAMKQRIRGIMSMHAGNAIDCLGDKKPEQGRTRIPARPFLQLNGLSRGQYD